MSIQTTEIQLQIKDKIANAYLAKPQHSGPGVLVLHAWWGLKPFFKQVCDRLAEQGFVVLAPDLYQGRVAKTIDEAKALMEQNDFELMGDTVKAAKDYLVSLRADKPIAVIGFSMGAAWSLVVASNEKDISATVLFYGCGEADFSKVSSKVLGHFAETDEWEPLDQVKAMEADMKSAGVDVTFHIYPNVGHWFVEEDVPEFDSASSLLAWSRTFEFLRSNL
ncbi:MAG: dienelactone hydrolase family protein [Anaerolineales bacterium]|nr:dienelactone hydrolase family protein [Anaerolineales bacterium]